MEPKVRDIMTRKVKTMQHDQVLLEALRFMREEHVRHIPVMRGDVLVGVITDRDIKRATPTALLVDDRGTWEQVVQETPLARVMTPDPITAHPGMTLREVLRILLDHKVGCLPVLEGQRLVGIVAAEDLYRAMLQVLEG
jgi:acetoin utilization protein AcuB